MHVRDRVKELRRVKAGELRPSPRNWRTHPQAQRDALRGILAEIGYADALLVREIDGGALELIDGHLRAETTPEQVVPVLVLDVDEAEANKLLATIDPLAALAGADSGKLAELLSGLESDNPALARMYADLARDAANAADHAVVQDEAPEPLPVAVTRPGDLWVLTRKRRKGVKAPVHRLLCGDSTNAQDVARVMAGETAALCATDPPYLVDYTGERPQESGKDWTATYREVDIKDAGAFFTALFTNVLAVLGPKAAIYCWHAHRRCGLIQRTWEALGILDHQQIIWVKPASVFGRVYWHFRHEPCMMGWRKGDKPEHDSDHSHNSVWEVGWEHVPGGGGAPGGGEGADGDVGTKARPGKNEHPTQKPVELFARPMRRHTAAGQIVFEPFSGSGSQLIAAEQLGRRCHAIEVQPVFVDVAVRRWQKLTGGEAVLESGGRSWAQIAGDRGVTVPKDGA